MTCSTCCTRRVVPVTINAPTVTVSNPVYKYALSQGSAGSLYKSAKYRSIIDSPVEGLLLVGANMAIHPLEAGSAGEIVQHAMWSTKSKE